MSVLGCVGMCMGSIVCLAVAWLRCHGGIVFKGERSRVVACLHSQLLCEAQYPHGSWQGCWHLQCRGLAMYKLAESLVYEQQH